MKTGLLKPDPTDDSRGEMSREYGLPPSLIRMTKLGVYAFIAGVLLMGLSFLTNPVPDPSFPWATLPATVRLPVTQPRIEHWPVTYTIGIWLWVFCFPALFLAGYRRYGDRNSGAAVWLVGLPTVAMLGWTTYCRFFWPKLQPPTWNAPAYTFVCWLYCSTYDIMWSNAAFLVALLGAVATVLILQRTRGTKYALIGFGILALPFGLPALYEGTRRVRTES